MFCNPALLPFSQRYILRYYRHYNVMWTRGTQATLTTFVIALLSFSFNFWLGEKIIPLEQ